MQSYIETHLSNENIKQQAKLIYQVAIAVLASVLIATSAQVAIYLGPVPITLQTFSVIFLALILGRKIALMSIGFYLLEIFSGLPVMASFQTLNPLSVMNFGYIIAFVPLVLMLTQVSNYQKKSAIFLLACLSNLVVYTIGSLWLGLFIGFSTNLLYVGVLPFLIPDVIKAVCAISLAKSVNARG